MKRICVKVQKVYRFEHCVSLCVLLCGCCPLGAAYLQSTVQERVCPLDLDVCRPDDGGLGYCDFITELRMHSNTSPL